MHHSLDTYAIIKRFTGAGIKENQAHEIVSAIVDSKNFELNNLVTKSDLKAEMSDVKTEFAEVRIEMEKIKNDILKWVIGLNITTITAMIACFKLLLPK